MTEKSCISRSLSGLDDSPPTLCPIPSCIAFINSDVDFCRKQQHTECTNHRFTEQRKHTECTNHRFTEQQKHTECTNHRFTEQRKLWIQDSYDFVQHGGIQKDENCDYHTRQLIEEKYRRMKTRQLYHIPQLRRGFLFSYKEIQNCDRGPTQTKQRKMEGWKLVRDSCTTCSYLWKYGTVIEMSHTELKYTSMQRNAG